MRQFSKRKGRPINPLQANLFLAAMLVFIFTVVYRMVKSEDVNAAVATLVESLLIVAFFIFLGIVMAYLLYFLHERIHKGSSRRLIYPLPDDTSGDDSSACDPDLVNVNLDSDEKTESQPGS
jgi:hypothetical protein